MRRQLHRAAFIGAVFIALFGAGVVHAASGAIDPARKYAWSSEGGWVNFAPSTAGVAVSDTALTGYAWSATDGWINFSPANGGVRNDGQGALSGFAWDESAGWVNFSGVTIDAGGLFHGEASGVAPDGQSYVVNFDCTNCAVATTWRPAPTNSGSTADEDGAHGWSGSTVVATTGNSPSTGQLGQPAAASGNGTGQGSGATLSGGHAATGISGSSMQKPGATKSRSVGSTPMPVTPYFKRLFEPFAITAAIGLLVLVAFLLFRFLL